MRTLLVAVLLSGCVAPAAGMAGANGSQGQRGPTGPEGPEGPAGPAGKNGKDASDAWRPVGFVSCNTLLDLISAGANGIVASPDGNRETLLEHTVMRYKNGDADVSCEARIGSSQSGADSSYYPATVKGAKTRICIAASDYPNPNGPNTTTGNWVFTGMGGVMQGEYRDPDNPLGLDGKFYVFQTTECYAGIMDDAGEWTDATVAEALQ